MGEDKFSRFVQQLGPKLYARLAKKNVKNLNAAYRNAMLQLAYESDYGNSPVAKRQHNYGGYGWNGKTYTTFRDDDSFLDAYTNLVTSRYRDAINSADLRSFATNLKKKGYFEDDLDHYYGQLAGMTSMAKAIDSHMSQNPDIYSFASQPIPANQQYIHQPVSTRVATRPEYSYQLPEVVVTGNRPKLTLPSISQSQEQAMAKQLLSASGFNPDMPMWEQYAPTYRPLVMPQHYEGGKEGENVHWSDKYNRDDIVNDLIEQYKQSEDFNTPLYERFKKTSAYKKAYKNSQWYADNQASRSLGLPEDDNVPYFQDAFDEWKTTKKAARYTDKLLRRQSEKYAANLNDIFNSIKYIDDYYKQSGIVPRHQDSHPNLYFKYGNVNGQSNQNDSKNSITFGMDFDPLLGGAYGTAAHEYAHYIDPYLKSQQGVPENYNTLYSRRHSDPYNPSDFEDHDSKPSENYADLVGSRGLMYKYGIWDSRNGGEIPMKAVQKFRKKYGSQSRLFRMYDDETIGQMYNTIAYNWPNRLNVPNLV